MTKYWWAVLVVGALAAAACGDPTVERTGDTEPGADDPVVFAPGTLLGDGFVVPASSVALTQPITPESPRDPSSWTVELIPADPIDTMNDLIAQASELDFDLGGFTPTPCVYDDEVPESGTSNTQPWPPPAGQATPRSVTCSVSGYRARDGVADRLWMQTSQRFTKSLGQSPGSSGSISVERLSTTEFGAHDGGHDYEPATIEPMPDTFPPAGPRPAPPELAAGDSLISTVEAGRWEAWQPKLVEGSRLVVPTSSSICQDGFASALDITGDPDTVMAGYIEQIRDWSAEHGQPPVTSELVLFDRRVVRSVASVDGSGLSATMVVGLDGEPTRINYTTCSS